MIGFVRIVYGSEQSRMKPQAVHRNLQCRSSISAPQRSQTQIGGARAGGVLVGFITASQNEI